MYSFPLSRRACFLWERRGLVVVGLRDATLCQGKGKGRCVRDSRHNVTTHTGFITLAVHAERWGFVTTYLDCVSRRRVHAELPVDIVDCKQLSSTLVREPTCNDRLNISCQVVTDFINSTDTLCHCILYIVWRTFRTDFSDFEYWLLCLSDFSYGRFYKKKITTW